MRMRGNRKCWDAIKQVFTERAALEIGISLARHSPVAPHVELALVLVRGAKPESLVEPQGGICLHHPEGHRPAGVRCLLDQAFDHLRADALPSQSAVYEQLAEEQCVIFHKALQPTDIGPAVCDDPNLRDVPALAKAGDLSVHAQIQLPDDALHALEIEARTIIEVFGAS